MDCGDCENIPFWRWLRLDQRTGINITCNEVKITQKYYLEGKSVPIRHIYMTGPSPGFVHELKSRKYGGLKRNDTYSYKAIRNLNIKVKK
jgi:hypothetical protein